MKPFLAALSTTAFSLTVLSQLCFSQPATKPNAETVRWWRYTQALANDNMQGRDTGSPGYRLAEAYVIQQFEKAGLQPAGTDGFRQPVPLHSVRLAPAGSPVQIVRVGSADRLEWYRQITVALRPNLPQKVEGPLYFVGNPARFEPDRAAGAVVVMLGAPRIRAAGSPPSPKLPSTAAGVITIDDLGGPEPPIWPVPYAASVTLAGAPIAPGSGPAGPVAFRFNPENANLLFRDSGHSFAELKAMQQSGQTLPNFPLSATFGASLNLDEQDIVSDNIIATLPGSDPVLRNEYVVLSAHLDGYGLGEPRHSDSIYNGAFDDAAYVALLIDLAQSLHESGTQLKRSLLFCVVTGEEKGLLGSRYFAAHPTRDKSQLIADLNLDQLRPIFPLKLLTVLALRQSTLGQTVAKVAQHAGIQIQEDPEPERNLLRRSDHYSFMQIGVPAVNFVFGYKQGSPEEKIYRAWYAERYHSPADDLEQPWVPEAAAKFNAFYFELVKAVANAAERPHWLSGSEFAAVR